MRNVVGGGLALLMAAAASSTPLPLLPRGRCVLDETRTLSVDTLDKLQRICVNLDHSGKGQLVVAVVTDLHGRYDLADLALDMFRAIRLGHRDRDDGVIVVLLPRAQNKGGIRVTIGYGLEGGLTDERIGSLLDDEAVPRLQRHDRDGALLAVSERLVSLVIEEDQSGRIERHAEQRRRERQSPH